MLLALKTERGHEPRNARNESLKAKKGKETLFLRAFL